MNHGRELRGCLWLAGRVNLKLGAVRQKSDSPSKLRLPEQALTPRRAQSVGPKMKKTGVQRCFQPAVELPLPSFVGRWDPGQSYQLHVQGGRKVFGQITLRVATLDDTRYIQAGALLHRPFRQVKSCRPNNRIRSPASVRTSYLLVCASNTKKVHLLGEKFLHFVDCVMQAGFHSALRDSEMPRYFVDFHVLVKAQHQ